MANVKISDLPAAASALDAMQLEVNDAGTSRRVTVAQVAANATSSLTVADITDLTATAAELNVLDGITATTEELNKTDGVVGNIVGTTDTQTLTNKTLTSPVINVTSDATGDIYYRSAGGDYTRLPIGSTDEVLTVSGGLPSWAAASGGGMALLETIQPTSDVSAITFVTTDFSGYETAEIWFFGTGESTPSEFAVQGQFGDATWRDLATFNDATDLNFPSDGSMIMLSSVIRNVGNADGTGVVTAKSTAGPDGQDVTWGRSSTGGEAAQDKIGHAVGFQARGSGLTGLRMTTSGGSFEGSDASTRCIAKLYAG